MVSFDWRMSDGKERLIAEWMEKTKLTPRCAFYLMGADLLDSLSDDEKELVGILRFPLDDVHYKEAQRKVKELGRERSREILLALQWLKDYENLSGVLRTYLWCEIHTTEEAEIFLVTPLLEGMAIPLELKVANQIWPLVRVSARSLPEVKEGCHVKELDFVAYQKELTTNA